MRQKLLSFARQKEEGLGLKYLFESLSSVDFLLNHVPPSFFRRTYNLIHPGPVHARHLVQEQN